ncbi:DUF3757 domain-containing protein [Pseudomonas agarici]|nr:DUF3757 domain-containing protein [Pseudomonas agarici]
MQGKIKVGLGLMVIALFTGNAYADTATCPHTATIKEQPLKDGGFSYSAPGPEGRMWTGENEYAAKSYLGEVNFTNAKFNTDSQAVICSYEGDGEAGIRLALKPFNQWKAANGTAWQKQDCADSDISKCSFEYQK